MIELKCLICKLTVREEVTNLTKKKVSLQALNPAWQGRIRNEQLLTTVYCHKSFTLFAEKIIRGEIVLKLQMKHARSYVQVEVKVCS